jgi:hypothetical protein
VRAACVLGDVNTDTVLHCSRYAHFSFDEVLWRVGPLEATAYSHYTLALRTLVCACARRALSVHTLLGASCRPLHTHSVGTSGHYKALRYQQRHANARSVEACLISPAY